MKIPQKVKIKISTKFLGDRNGKTKNKEREDKRDSEQLCEQG